MSEAEVKQALDSVRTLLDQGQADAATAELQKVLASDSVSKAAQSYMRQIRDDPVMLYGRESFPYRVQSGDTLALLAQRYLGDRDQFYGLARYNDIAVPRQLPLGQTIRIPGKAGRVVQPVAATPVAPTAPVATPEPAAAPAPVASTPAPPPPAPPPPPPPPPDPAIEAARVEREKKAAVDNWSRRARAAMARQDLCGAIKGWEEVLSIEPDNRTAMLERDRARELQKKLPASKC